MAAPTSTSGADTDVAMPELSSGQRRALWLGTGIALLGSALLIASLFVPWVELDPIAPITIGNPDYFGPVTILAYGGQPAAVLFLVQLLVAAALGIFALAGFLRRRPGYLPRTLLGWAIIMCLFGPITTWFLLASINYAFFQAMVSRSDQAGPLVALAGFGCVFVGAILLSIGRRGELVDYYHQVRVTVSQRPARWKPPTFWAGAVLVPIGSLLVIASLFVPWAPGSLEYRDHHDNFLTYFSRGGLVILELFFLAVLFFAIVPALSALAGLLRHRVSVKLRLELDCAQVACVVGLITTLTVLSDVFNPNALPAVQSGWTLAVAGFAGILVGAVLLGIGRSGSLEDYY